MTVDSNAAAGLSAEALRAILAEADPNVLRLAIYQATRDPELAAMRVESMAVRGGAYRAPVLAKEHREEVIAKALAFLQAGGAGRQSAPDETELRGMMALFAGHQVSTIAYELGKVDLVEDPLPIRAVWTREPPAEVKQRYHVAIVGAGFGGMATAIQLQRLGIPFTIIERDPEVGGTWWRTRYPEARVDISSYHYQFSFMRHYPWKNWFATASELLDYARAVADEYDLRPHIRFETELTDAVWDEANARWQLTLRKADGTTEQSTATMLVSAAGLFNEARMPDIPGIETFAGDMLHSADWDHSVALAGKRIAQIGVGSSGAQMMPHLAREAAELTVFQRSPQWVMPVDRYRDPIGDKAQWLIANFPNYWQWLSFAAFYGNLGADPWGLHDYDREWQEAGGLVSERNDALRAFCKDYIASKLGDNPELVKKVTPDFPPYGKRPVIDNGWFDALNRPNVHLVTDPIERITEHAVVTAGGVEHPADVLVLCAGFNVQRYLWPTRYVGRGGKTLEQAWAKDGARAYLGVTVPDFPNLFILYGPNAQLRLGGLIKWLEVWARYSVSLIAQVIERGACAVAVKQEVCDRYNAELDAATVGLVWGETPSYFHNDQGRQGVNAPWAPDAYWTMIREANPADFTWTSLHADAMA